MLLTLLLIYKQKLLQTEDCKVNYNVIFPLSSMFNTFYILDVKSHTESSETRDQARNMDQ